MTFDQVFQDYDQITVVEIVFRIGFAFALGFGIAQIYRWTHKGPMFSSSFMKTLIMLSMITAVVMMVIGNSLARAFGLVGAMAIIRFRTALKETRDIAFVFFSLAVGMAIGIGRYSLAFVSAVVISVCIVMLTPGRFYFTGGRALLLRFQVLPTEHPERQYIDTFRNFLKSWKLLDMKSIRMGQFLEISFEVRFKDSGRAGEFVAMLTGVEGLEKVHLVMGDEETEMSP